MKRWQNVNGIYQIYPRSFKDTNSDGVGDLAGITEKLDYINGKPDSLGINAIWLSPFYPSPMADFGYDITDYCGVNPLFGTLDDFSRLIDEAHARDIKVMIDYVPNHTSDEHAWFEESKSSRENKKRDWYVWRDPKPDGTPPNNWLSVFGGSAWEFDPASGQYYLHSFLTKQPDLNWSNPEVREAMCDVLHFWLKIGVDGIRADAVRWISKDPDLRDNPLNPNYEEGKGMDPYLSQIQTFSRYGVHLFAHLRQISDVIESYPDRIILFEDYPDASLDLKSQYSEFYAVNPHVAAPFNFEGFKVEYGAGPFRKFIDRFQADIGVESRPFYCFGNHDKPRLVSRVGKEQAKLLGLLQLTLPGTPVIYYGDEIGMKNGIISPDKVHDPFEKQTPGLGLGRDPERTPMQWSAEPFAGFSRVEPWLPIASDFTTENAVEELHDPTSFLYMYRALLSLRDMHVLRFGTYAPWDGSDEFVYGYFREDTESQILILLNMSAEPTMRDVGIDGQIMYSTHAVDNAMIGNSVALQAYHGVVIRNIR
ncbi:MAG: putative Oligo,6-glucosidase [Candidatus Saccharibacteria bacterium]|nr:putative Oligo,6-glucosidase [Candidatus Saccharibacteria bacterium]